MIPTQNENRGPDQPSADTRVEQLQLITINHDAASTRPSRRLRRDWPGESPLTMPAMSKYINIPSSHFFPLSASHIPPDPYLRDSIADNNASITW